jgi:hypothetical protein
MIPVFKIRCSAIGKIMGGVNRPTEKQLAYLDTLEKKATTVKGLTAKQKTDLADLKAKRDAPPALQDGAKTYCQEWLKEQLYARKKEFSNKYTEKGIQCEQSGINLVTDMMGYGFIAKNEQHFEDDDITGTPDLILSDTVEDIKNSWSCFTFPLFAKSLPESDYFYQLQGYMALTGKNKAAVNYCLIDTPEELIDREARYQSYKAGFEDVDTELYDMVMDKMTYGKVDNSLRFKRFEFDKDEAVISEVRSQVRLCREYIASILIPFQQSLLNAA